MGATDNPRRGLVLGGGGMLGAAWMTGALRAIEQVAGFDPRTCDVIVGTSAGSVVGSLLAAGVSVKQMLDHQRGTPMAAGPLAGYSFDYEKGAGPSRPRLPKLLGPGSGKLIAKSAGRIGRVPPTAILAAWMPQGRGSLSRIGHLVEAFTPMGEWSSHSNLWLVALDYDSGERVVFGRDRHRPASLADAVMASCAIPAWFAPAEFGGHRYIDGGAWSATNADLLTGLDLDEVYVVAPMVSFELDQPKDVMSKLERRWRVQVTKRCLSEANQVRAGGTSVVIVGPTPEDLEAMGGNAMDASRRLRVLETSLRTTPQQLRDPDHLGPDHVADVG